MKKALIIILVFLSIYFIIASGIASLGRQFLFNTLEDFCTWTENIKYNEDWIVGKGSAEIIKKYGEFDIVQKRTTVDGDFYGALCGYRTKKETSDFIFNDIIPEEFFVIYFNSDNVAYDTERNYIDKRKYI